MRRKAFAIDASSPIRENEASNRSLRWNATRKSCFVAGEKIGHKSHALLTSYYDERHTLLNLSNAHSCDSPGQWPGKSVAWIFVTVSALMPMIWREEEKLLVTGANSHDENVYILFCVLILPETG